MVIFDRRPLKMTTEFLGKKPLKKRDPINAQSRALGHAKPTTESGHEENIKRLMQQGGNVLGERARRHILHPRCFEKSELVRLRRNL
jgi:hypothetical protein